MSRVRTLARLATLALLSIAASAYSQDRGINQFAARITTVPIGPADRDTVAGSGAATARLDGRTLRVQGTFAGLKGSATTGALHLGSVTGVRGPAIAELDVTPAASGEISGRVELSATQVDALREGRVYIQLASAAAPEGNLWGWLLAADSRP